MQLKITNLASASRKIKRDMGNNGTEDLETPVCSNRVKDIGQMIVMSGTANRKLSKKFPTFQPNSIIKNQYRESLLKLRTPYYKTRQKHQAEEKLLNKSCEILFQHLKPYKDIQIIKGNNAHKGEWNLTTESILKTTNIVYKKTATRKVEILSFFEEIPNYNSNKEKTSISDYLRNESSFLFESEHFNSEDNYKNLVAKYNSQVMEGFNTLQKAVSSEDFITNAFSKP